MANRFTRRQFIRAAGAMGASLALPALLSACGLSAPAADKPAGGSAAATVSSDSIKIGFIPLTDCASVVMARELDLYKKYGLPNVEVTKEASWATIRDKLLTGDLQAAHCLFGMPFSVYTGVGGQAGKEMPIAMMLDVNGQGITLPKEWCHSVGFRGVDKVQAAVAAMQAQGKEVTFAMTFPGGTHDLWLRLWLAAAGIDQTKVKIITIPPPQMVANMKVGNMTGYSVGEPWNGVGVAQDVGFTHISSQDVWKHHPEKALVLNKEFSLKRDVVKAVMKAVLEASIWLDDLDNRKEAAKIIGGQAYVNAAPEVIEGRLLGRYNLGCDLGEHTYQDDYMLFHNGGQVNFPRKAHGIFFMTQYVRFGYLPSLPDYQKAVDTLIMQDLYREVAAEMNIPVPDDDMKPFNVTIDGHTFDPQNPAAALQLYGGGKA